jgi:hypothetical protein
MKTERRPLSTHENHSSLRIPHTSAESAGPPGGQPQNYRRVNDIRKFGVVNEEPVYFLSEDLAAGSAFGLLSFLEPESWFFAPESFEDSPWPSESDLADDPPEGFFG